MGIIDRLRSAIGGRGGKDSPSRDEWLGRLAAASGQPKAVVERALAGYPPGPEALHKELVAGRVRLNRTGQLLPGRKQKVQSVEDRVRSLDRRIRGERD